MLMQIGPVVHRESIPLSQLENVGDGERGMGESFIRVRGEQALFSTARWFASADDSAALVTKGSVVIKDGSAEIVYRAALGPTLFLIMWFGLLTAFEISIWFVATDKPLGLALILFAMMAGAALIVRRTVRVEVGRLRGLALKAAMRLRDRL
jgi:hypothetical protein